MEQRKQPVPGERYRHFKGNYYQVVGVATHSETGEKLVIYQALYGDYTLYARPLSQFMSETDFSKYPDAKQRYRFERDMRSVPADHAAFSENNDDRFGEGEANSEKGKEGFSEAEGEYGLLMRFLDAEDARAKQECLSSWSGDISDSTLDSMAASLDLQIGAGTQEERLAELMRCLGTLSRYDQNRMR